jgi:hypothetical protein
VPDAIGCRTAWHHRVVRQGRDREPETDHDVRGHDPVGTAGERQERQRRDWLSRLILWLAAAVLGLALVVIAGAYLPGRWADLVAEVVAANWTAGVLGGVAFGVVFSVLPLLVLRSAVRRHHRWPARLVRLGDAVLLAVPNLLTLGVVSRGGRDGEAARAVFDVRAPGFAWGTLIGVMAGTALVVISWALLAGRRRRLHELHDLRTRLELRAARDGRGARNVQDGGEPREARSDNAPDD